MKLSKDESRAVAFIALLLAVSAVVRVVDRPEPLTVEGPGVDLAALEAENRRKAEQSRAPERTEPPATRRSPARASQDGPRPTGSTRDAAPVRAPEPVDVNRASVEELTRLPGVGDVIARRIIAYRDSVGGFRSVEQLERVRGIGPALMRRISPMIRVGS